MKKAVFIDKDGTLIKNIPYNIDRTLIKLEDTVQEGLSILYKNDYKLIIISNQSGIADGFFEEKDLENVNDELQLQLAAYNIKLDGFYYCPHLPEGSVAGYATDCECRKPKPGLIFRAGKDFDIDLSASWMIGDILNDIEAGNSAGCKTILIDNGNETEWILNKKRFPQYTVHNFADAAEIIVFEEKRKK